MKYTYSAVKFIMYEHRTRKQSKLYSHLGILLTFNNVHVMFFSDIAKEQFLMSMKPERRKM